MFANKKKLQSYLSEEINAEVIIKGKLVFKMLPQPHIVITHLRINNLRRNIMSITIRAPEAKVFPNFLSLLSFNVIPRRLNFKNSQLNIELVGIDKETSKVSGPLSDNISFTESTLLITNSQYSLEKKFNNLTLHFDKIDNYYNIAGNFESNLNKYKIQAQINEAEDQKLEFKSVLKSGDNKLKFEGFFNKKNLEFYGNNKITGTSLQKFLFGYVYRSDVFFPDGTDYEYELDFDLKLDDTGITSDNIVIKSPSLNSTAKFTLHNNGMGELNFDIIDVQIDDIISDEDESRVKQELFKLGPDDQIYLQMPDTGTFSVNVNAENFNLYKHSLSDLTANITFDGEKKNKKFKLEFAHSQLNDFKIYGDITNDIENNLYIKGDIESNGSNLTALAHAFDLNINLLNKEKFTDYTLLTKFQLADNIYHLTDIDAKFDDTNLTGNVNINNNTEDKSSKINIFLDKVNLDHYELIDFDGNKRNLFDYAFGSLSKDSDNRSLFQKFLWLRNINSTIKYKISIDDFVANNIPDKNLSIGGKLDHRYFSIDSFNIQSKKNSFSSKFIIDINDINPRVDFYLDGSLINADFLGNDSHISEWSTEYFRIPDFSDLPGTIKVDIKNLNYKDLNLSNIKITTHILDNVLYFDDFHGNIFNTGKFNIAGNYIISGVPTLNIAFTFTKLKLQKLSYLFFKADKFKTLANVTGTINSFGQNIEMFMKSARSDIRMITRAVTMTDYNIKDLIQYIADLSNYEEGLDEYNMESLLKNGEITFGPLDLSLKIRKGILKIDNLTLKTESATSIYSGLIRLPDQNFILHNVNLFTAYYRSGDEVKGQMLRFDRKYSGNLFDPAYVLDDTQVKNFVLNIENHAKDVLKERDNQRDKQKEALKERQKQIEANLKEQQEEEEEKLQKQIKQ
ncbi:MAG: hypothetical protein HOM96_04190 [Rickettsiales bacterium]|nr:hypothetical protein [Rickettsiales bacterium]